MSAVKTRSNDLTQGNITLQLVSFMLPILLGQIFQNLYNSVDAIVVGRFVGPAALASVTSSADLSFLLISFFTGLSTGAGVLFSRYFGAKDEKNLHTAIHTAMCFCILLGVATSVVGILFTPQLLRIVSCPEEAFADSVIYLRIYLIGTLFTSLYNIGSGILRAVGNSRDPFLYLVAASITNIVLDVVFVAWLKMGVTGVAIATVVSQLLSVSLTFANLLRTRDVYRLIPRDLKIDKAMMLQIVDLGFPAGIQMAIVSIANLFIQRFINMAGVAAMGGIGAAKKVDKFIGMMAYSAGQSATTFISQNMGAQKPRRAFAGLRVALYISGGCAMVMGTVIYFYADVVIALFCEDPATIGYGVDMLHAMMPLYLLHVLYAIFSNAVRGFGKSKSVMVFAIVGLVGCRQLFLQIAMAINGSVSNIYYAYPIGWGCAAVMCIVYYYFTVIRPYRRQQLAC